MNLLSLSLTMILLFARPPCLLFARPVLSHPLLFSSSSLGLILVPRSLVFPGSLTLVHSSQSILALSRRLPFGHRPADLRLDSAKGIDAHEAR